MTDLPPITLPAEHIAAAWRNAAMAAGDDGRVLVEWHTTGLRFVGTDGFVVVASWAYYDRDLTVAEAPAHDEAPLGQVVAISTDRLMPDFLKHRTAEVKAYARALNSDEGTDGEPPDVTISVGTIDEPDTAQQRLDLGMAQVQRLVVSCESERIALPLHDREFGNWRGILASYKPSPRARVQVRPSVLARIGQLSTLPFTEASEWLRLTMANNGALVMVEGLGRVPVEGAFTPRTEVAAEQEEAA